MVRPTQEMTQRELEVMHAFWQQGQMTATQAREALAESGVDRAYPTVANLIRVLVDKGYLEAINDERPFIYQALHSFEDVSKNFVGELVDRVFRGSREQLIVHLFGQRQSLSKKERSLLESILEEHE